MLPMLMPMLMPILPILLMKMTASSVNGRHCWYYRSDGDGGGV
jgi:hypothetical protein